MQGMRMFPSASMCRFFSFHRVERFVFLLRWLTDWSVVLGVDTRETSQSPEPGCVPPRLQAKFIGWSERNGRNPGVGLTSSETRSRSAILDWSNLIGRVLLVRDAVLPSWDFGGTVRQNENGMAPVLGRSFGAGYPETHGGFSLCLPSAGAVCLLLTGARDSEEDRLFTKTWLPKGARCKLHTLHSWN